MGRPGRAPIFLRLWASFRSLDLVRSRLCYLIKQLERLFFALDNPRAAQEFDSSLDKCACQAIRCIEG